MKLTRIIVLGVAAVVLTSLSCQAAAVGDFARAHLKLDLAAYPFGSLPERYSDLERTTTKGGATILSGKNPPSDYGTNAYHRIELKFVQENLVEVTVVCWGKVHNQELLREFTRLSGINPRTDKGIIEDRQMVFSFQDTEYKVTYMGMCSHRDPSVARFKFTPVVK
jgi:hypothetical protein